MKKFIIAVLMGLQFLSTHVLANEVINIWPRIPFNIQGANLCEFTRAYSQSRQDYMNDMVYHAQALLWSGDLNPSRTIYEFNQLYNYNLAFAKKGLGITLEKTFKAFLEQYYRQLRPSKRYLEFKYTQNLDQIINMAIRGRQVPEITSEQMRKIDMFAYGTYSMDPRCNGNVIVTLSTIGKNGLSKTYIGRGPVHTVMSQIASSVFEDYQRTKFPSTINLGSRSLRVIGGPNGDIARTQYLEQAENICKGMGARLPNSSEYKLLDSYGSWSGGITLGQKIWAMNYPYVFVPYFTNSPSRHFNQVNDKEFYYICVQ